MSIKSQVIDIIAKELDMDPKKITPASTFDDLGVDSLTGIEIMLAVEHEFGIELPEDATPPTTVQDVINFLA
jgi:acyl carrier protein